jgi:hypothetical protein
MGERTFLCYSIKSDGPYEVWRENGEITLRPSNDLVTYNYEVIWPKARKYDRKRKGGIK